MKTPLTTATAGLAMAAMMTVTASAVAAGQSAPTQDAVHGNSLVGVWEEEAPVGNDCQTGEPFGPTIRALLIFNQGGTMYVEDTYTGAYRSTGGGIWTRTTGREYVYGNVHYEFDPDRTFLLSIKARSTLTLSQDGESFTEKGTFEGIDPTGQVLFGGCFVATAKRVAF
jgi:hypothetical protein